MNKPFLVEQEAAPFCWEEVRAEFPLNPDYLHFSQFFMVSQPYPVRRAIQRFRDEIDADPFLAVEAGMFAEAETSRVEPVYEAVAAYTGGAPCQIALIPNSTTGLALAYHGLPLGPGDEVLTTTDDHFSHHEAIRMATERAGATWRKVRLICDTTAPDIDGIVLRLRAAIRPETRAIGITWVHSNHGLCLPIQPLAELVRAINRTRPIDKRILLIVDGTHGFGARAERVADMGCDIFISSLHKWMCGPRGTGIMWAKADVWPRLRPSIPTYYTWDLIDAWAEERACAKPVEAKQVSPGGFLAYENQWAIPAALEFVNGIGRERIARRISQLNGRIIEGLKGIPGVRVHTPSDPKWYAGIICFEVAGLAPETVVERLLEKKIIASTAPYARAFARLSAGIMNSPDEVDRAVAEVARIAAAAKAAASLLVELRV